MSRFEVSKAGFEQHRVADLAKRELAEGEVRLAIDFFAFTANNMTYAVAGDILNYWQFFPVQDDPGFGVIPVWGFADVVESACEGVAEGDRLGARRRPARTDHERQAFDEAHEQIRVEERSELMRSLRSSPCGREIS